MKLQHQLFEHIRNHYSKATFSLVDDLCALLQINKSTAYKRISGDTPLKLDEIRLVCNHYGVSLDSLFFQDQPANITSFRQEVYYRQGFTFTQFLYAFAATFDTLRKGKDNTLIILANYIPVFYFFGFPRLAYFLYLSSKSEAMHYQPYTSPITYLDIDDEGKRIMRYLHEEYTRHPSTELLSPVLFDSALTRLRLALEIGMLTPALHADLTREMVALCTHLETQSATGKKINTLTGEKASDTTFLVNHNHYFGYNEIYYCTDNYEKSFVGNSPFHFLATSDPHYCAFLREKLTRIKNLSHNITVENSMERLRFFQNLKERIKNFT